MSNPTQLFDISQRVRGELYKFLLSPSYQDAIVSQEFQDAYLDTVKRQLTPDEKKPLLIDPPHEIKVGASFYGQAKKCPRKAWYKIRNFDKGVLTPNAKLKFMYGDSIEFLVILIAKHTNLCIENTQAQVSKTYDTQGGKFTVRGMMDCTVDGNVFDVKSASTYAFKKFKDLQDSGNESQFINNDAFAYVDQLDVYSGILHADNAIHPQGWIAVEKQLGHIATPVIESEAAWDRHVPLVDAQMRAPLPPERNAGTDHHLPVADGKSGNMKLPISCSYCDYKRNCWQDANGGRGIRTFLYSNKPVDLVVVSREPKVKELL